MAERQRRGDLDLTEDAETAEAEGADLTGSAGPDQAYGGTDWSFQGYAAAPGGGAKGGGSPLAARHHEATRTLDRVRSSIDLEDHGTARSTGQAKDDAVAGMHTVAHQLEERHPGVLRAAITAQRACAARRTEATVSAFERAVAALEAAYLSTYLVSTDGPNPTTAWVEPADHSMLNLTAANGHDQVRSLMSMNGGGHYLKFAIPAAHPDQLHAGTAAHAHQDIAGGNAMTAGVFTLTADDQIAQLENTSGGFRPGPLRNQLAAALFTSLGFTIATTLANDTGGYGHSAIDHRPGQG